MVSFLEKECNLKFFHEHGYIRKCCKICGDYFWTLDKSEEICGDRPCVEFSFIGNPIGKKGFSLNEVRDSFLSFFEKNNHSRLRYPETGERCPVVARWRTDIYLTIASIADFQPHVTSGEVPPPANPLVISQPCIRLNDLEEIGVSGRHLSMFEMMGHHAFNKNIDEIYWKEETVAFCDEYFTKKIGIPKEVINYKEQLWDGGGNAGPCLEVLAGGLEIATLVFMNLVEDKKGKFTIKGKQYSSNPLNIVDTGYGLERIAWLTQGTNTVYETVFPEVIDFIKDNAKSKNDLFSIFSLADHSKCLAFMLGDGIVPSNVKAGYLARLMIRRALRFIKKLSLKVNLEDIVDIHLELLNKEFPSLKQKKDQINEILDIETKRFFETLKKGESLVKRILKDQKNIGTKDLITLYDTHGMPTDIVKKIAEKEGKKIEIPDNFDSMIAELHSHEKNEKTSKKIKKEIPETIPLYYENHYCKEFNATVLWKNKNDGITQIILDKTAFYPEGGGQPGDIGIFELNGKKIQVISVEKEGKSIIHFIKGDIDIGDKVHGKINWEHRYTLMKHHTGTHLVNGALRKLLGEHIWQAGSQLSLNEARFDFSHYKSISENEIKKIEEIANSFIEQKVKVNKKIMKRNDAEKEYGFRLYQGGVPPGNLIRVLDIPGIDVEACGGTHLNNTEEVEKIRIIKTERIQDGVNRIIFAAGKMVDEFQKEESEQYNQIIKTISPVFQIQEHKNISSQLKKTASIFSVPIEQLNKTLNRFLMESSIKEKKTVLDLKEASEILFNKWKETQKNKKKISPNEIEILKESAESIPDTKIKIITGRTSSDGITLAGAIISEPNYVVHIYDGKKITSTASDNIDIDLRKIAPVIGKIIGGSGGGKPKMTQSGGPNQDKIQDALIKAKQMTIEILKK